MRISDWSSDVCSSDLLGEKIVVRNAEDEKFEHVFLIDDFTASGTTFIRQVKGKWKGKLQRFNAIVDDARKRLGDEFPRSEEHTSELQSLMRISYAFFYLYNKRSHYSRSFTTHYSHT